jgi:hypothetical protein
MPERDLRLADALRVGEQACTVEIGQRAGDHVLVRHAAGLEAAAPEAAQLHGMVDELVVARRLVRAATGPIDLDRPHCGRDLPAGRQAAQLDAVRLGLAALDAQAQRGAVEEAAVRVDKGGAHRGVERIDQVADDQRRAPFAARQPGRLVELLQRQLARALLRAQLRQVARELAHQVAAGDPRRQAQALLGSRPRHGEGDAKQVGMRLRDFDSVGEHREAAFNCRRRRRSNSGSRRR